MSESRLKMKVMLSFFFDDRSVVGFKMFPLDQTVNMEYHLSAMPGLCEAIFKKRSNLWKDNSGFDSRTVSVQRLMLS